MSRAYVLLVKISVDYINRPREQTWAHTIRGDCHLATKYFIRGFSRLLGLPITTGVSFWIAKSRIILILSSFVGLHLLCNVEF